MKKEIAELKLKLALLDAICIVFLVIVSWTKQIELDVMVLSYALVYLLLAVYGNHKAHKK